MSAAYKIAIGTAKVLAFFGKFLKPLLAEKAAGEAPEKFNTADEAIFDAALRRIEAADAADPIFTRVLDGVQAKFFTPDFLKSKNVQDWLQKPEVKSDLKRAASARLLHSRFPPGVMEGLEISYGAVAMARPQESAPVVAAVVAVLAAAVNSRVGDAGTAALVAVSGKEITRGIEGISSKLDSLVFGAGGHSLAVPIVDQLDAMTAKAWREAFKRASAGLLRWPTTLGNGEHIARPEIDQLLAGAQSTEGGAVALLGDPGSGKSALLAQLGQELAAIPNSAVLAIKSDLLDADVATEEDLKRDLQLQELPSIMLARLAQLGPVTLLIDQLDALAGHLDVRTGRLSVLLNLVKVISEVDGVYVVVSCRTFEFTHDIRLSRIDAESLKLQLPSWDQVLPVLEAHGVKAAGWNSDAREVLCVPQQLNAYLQLKSSGIDEPVSTYTAMLDSLWRVRILEAPGGAQAAQLAFEIAESMADKEALWLAGARFDHRMDDLKRLLSTGLLIESEQGAIGFSHQTVFEHVLARSFAKNDGRLSAYVLARNDSLFVRPKLWAALGYLRSVEPTTYEIELTTIWNAHELRKHLRFLLIEFMGSQPKPTDKEEVLLATAGGHPALSALVLKAISGSPGWFERFSSTVIAAGMADETTADLCVQLLCSAWSFEPAKVEHLLLNIWATSLANDRRTLFVLEEAPVWTPSLVDAAKAIVDRAELSAFHVDRLIGVVGGTAPTVAMELLRLILDKELSAREREALSLKAVAEQEKPAEGEADIAWHMAHNSLRPLEALLEDEENWSSVPALAAALPAQFIALVWPWYLSAFRSLVELSMASKTGLSYPHSYRTDFRFDGEDKNGLGPSSLLEAIALAVEKLAESSPQEFLKWADGQFNVELAPVQRLVAHGLAQNPSQTATAALTFLVNDGRRYRLGGISDAFSTTLTLVAACAPYWSAEEVARFTAKVKEYAPVRPTDRNTPADIRLWHRSIRRTRVNMLRALPSQARSQEIQREVEQADRAGPRRSSDDHFVGGWIGPPMDAGQLAKASNEDIVNAFREIPDKSEWDHPKHFGRGGNIQLARAFADFAKEHCVRAVEVMQQLQPDYGQRAVGYALTALAEVFEPPAVMSLIEQFHERGFHAEEFKVSVARAVNNLLNRDVVISNSLLHLLEEWLWASTAAAASHDSGSEHDDGNKKDEGFLLSGHPHVRVVPDGDYSFLSVLVHARLARHEAPIAIQLLRSYLERSQDKVIWEFLTHVMVPLPSLDTREGPALIGEVLSLMQLDGSHGAAVLMANTHWKALGPVMTNLGRWRDSTSAVTRKGYGELVALIALANPSASLAVQLLDELVEAPGQKDARVGATATLVQLLWIEQKFRASATDFLLRLLEKNEVAVWQQVFRLFGLVDKLDAEPHTVRLLRGISDRIDEAPAPPEPYVVERLGTLLPHHADIVARIATQLIQLWRDKLANVGSSIVSAGQEMTDLAITLHRTEGTKLQGLQMFEQLIEIDAYQAREVLDELDRRLRLGARPLRRRLPRRSRRRSRKPA